MRLDILMILLALTSCGLADPEVIIYESPDRLQDSADGTHANMGTSSSDSEIFEAQILPVIKSECTRCHSPQHRLPFAIMPGDEIRVKLTEAVGCGEGSFEQFLRDGHPGGDQSRWLNAATRQNFRSSCD